MLDKRQRRLTAKAIRGISTDLANVADLLVYDSESGAAQEGQLEELRNIHARLGKLIGVTEPIVAQEPAQALPEGYKVYRATVPVFGIGIAVPVIVAARSWIEASQRLEVRIEVIEVDHTEEAALAATIELGAVYYWTEGGWRKHG